MSDQIWTNGKIIRADNFGLAYVEVMGKHYPFGFDRIDGYRGEYPKEIGLKPGRDVAVTIVDGLIERVKLLYPHTSKRIPRHHCGTELSFDDVSYGPSGGPSTHYWCPKCKVWGQYHGKDDSFNRSNPMKVKRCCICRIVLWTTFICSLCVVLAVGAVTVWFLVTSLFGDGGPKWGAVFFSGIMLALVVIILDEGRKLVPWR